MPALFLLSLLTHECTRLLFPKAGSDKGNSRLFTVNKPRPTGRRIMSPGYLKHSPLTPSSKIKHQDQSLQNGYTERQSGGPIGALSSKAVLLNAMD